MRSIWKGALTFSMVAIPVKLYGASENKSISLNQLHTECGSRIKMPKYCPKCDRHLEAGEIVKAYPIDKENYIPLTPEELESLPLQSTKNIVVEAFMKGDITDPRWYNSAYFLAPEDVGTKAFVLFVKAMEAAGVVGVAKIALRERERMCVVRPFDGILMISTLNWGDELRPYDELRVFASVSDKELEMAQALISAMTQEVDLNSYHDNYRTAMVELITAKLEGKTIEAPIVAKKQEADLADALIASLNALEPEKLPSDRGSPKVDWFPISHA